MQRAFLLILKNTTKHADATFFTDPRADRVPACQSKREILNERTVWGREGIRPGCRIEPCSWPSNLFPATKRIQFHTSLFPNSLIVKKGTLALQAWKVRNL